MAQSMRTIRMKNKAEEEKFKTKTGRTIDELLEVAGRDLKESDIRALIDLGGEFDELQKELAGTVKGIKTQLIEAAKAHKWKSREGENFKCPVSQQTTTELDAKDLAKLLKEMGKKDLFWDLIKVAIGEAKKYLGEATIEPIAFIDIEEYGSIRFKRKKK